MLVSLNYSLAISDARYVKFAKPGNLFRTGNPPVWLPPRETDDCDGGRAEGVVGGSCKEEAPELQILGFPSVP